MIDTLVEMLPRAKERMPSGTPSRYVLVTLHRPSNVDDIAWLERMLQELSEISVELPVLFPVHPRTTQRLNANNLKGRMRSLLLMDPLPYLDFLALQTQATVVITDSGGIQEETTFLGVPCLTVRENTERPITAEIGTNTLVGRSIPHIRREVQKVLNGEGKRGRIPPLWDGHAAERIATVLAGARAMATEAGRTQ
jgi:UDP-N-acetylglucosamine 2-epimerase (non-hydrolysing)